MLDKGKLTELKLATVGIGVLSKPTSTTREVELYGTGFFVSSDGWVMTVNHVVKPCLRVVQFKMNKKIDVGLVAMQLRFYPQGKFKLTLIPMESPVEVHLGSADITQSPDSQKTDLDVVILRPKEGNVRDTPFLKIKKSSPPILYDEIAMCGYPSGKKSFNLSQQAIELRLSPVMQFGRIAGLMPFDTADYPYGIQTDIVGTGGSSGSPIIEAKSGDVVAIAQEVLPASVGGKAVFAVKDKPLNPPLEGEISALSNIGLTFGISHNLLDGIVEGVRKQIESGIMYNDKPKISLVRGGTWEIGYG